MGTTLRTINYKQLKINNDTANSQQSTELEI